MVTTPNRLGRLVIRAAPVFNTPVAALAKSERFGGLVNRRIPDEILLTLFARQ